MRHSFCEPIQITLTIVWQCIDQQILFDCESTHPSATNAKADNSGQRVNVADFNSEWTATVPLMNNAMVIVGDNVTHDDDRRLY